MKNDTGRPPETCVSGRRTRGQRKGNEYPAAIAAPLMPGLEGHDLGVPSAHRPGHHLKGERA
jgi:hypothetical protein